MTRPTPPDPYHQQPSWTGPNAVRPYSGSPYSGPPYSGPPYPGQPYSGPPYPGLPYSGPPYPVVVAAPYGVDPMTGIPLSDKSRVAAGLLQLLPGFFFGVGGIGRLYAGHTAIGVIQLVASFVGWVSIVCGFLLVFPLLFTIGVWLWFVIDGIVLLAGRSTDSQGRLLRA
jgi:TM2 domain-containing membrane protein YozV